MKNFAITACSMLLLLLSMGGTIRSQSAAAQPRPPVKCTENSPERRGEEGCTILVSRPLAGAVTRPLYWHIDRFDSLEAAKKAAGPDGVAAEAHGSIWLMTVEPRTKDHHAGRHVAEIGPLALPAADRYSMRVNSTFLKPGSITPVHTHSGPEVFYIVVGEQCLETENAGHHVAVGKTHVIPSDTIHRGRVTGPTPRGALTLVLHDAARPSSHDLTDPPQLNQCK